MHDDGEASAWRREEQSMLAMAKALGWFSIGLGLAELVAPRSLARFLGMDQHATLIQAYGLREIAAGVGILTQRDPTPWVWARVGGDALDIATLAVGLGSDNPQRANVGFALAAVAGVTALDIICSQRLHAEASREAKVVYDYSDRSGLPRGIESARGAARDLDIPRDMRTPEGMQPYSQTSGTVQSQKSAPALAD